MTKWEAIRVISSAVAFFLAVEGAAPIMLWLALSLPPAPLKIGLGVVYVWWNLLLCLIGVWFLGVYLFKGIQEERK